MAKHTAKESHHDHDMGGVDLGERHFVFSRFVKAGFITAIGIAVLLLVMAKFLT